MLWKLRQKKEIDVIVINDSLSQTKVVRGFVKKEKML